MTIQVNRDSCHSGRGEESLSKIGSSKLVTNLIKN
jgi:hypothetical protein